ncbi:hypothetical protein L1987_55567 [Smallanthus sonchifolius]|uniref:Uncharacterized protein n=1 Tax=Smallanthus sonchifolius TaxID=185202 RepID=A0ACB9EAE8_9ASTR|nr:hypothetical protein L1987_55567 [Smallanthus sonchifolius]
MNLLVRKLLDEFPSKAPIREHRTREIELREVEADIWPLSTTTANPLSLPAREASVEKEEMIDAHGQEA